MDKHNGSVHVCRRCGSYYSPSNSRFSNAPCQRCQRPKVFRDAVRVARERLTVARRNRLVPEVSHIDGSVLVRPVIVDPAPKTLVPRKPATDPGAVHPQPDRFAKVCACGREFLPRGVHWDIQVECRPCRKARHKARTAEANGGMDHPVGISTGTVGAIGELIVCADLLTRGFHAFRAQSPNCPCDVIAMKGDRVWRVEVRTGRRKADGRLSYPSRAHGPIECFAVVLPDHSVVYIPDLF